MMCVTVCGVSCLRMFLQDSLWRCCWTAITTWLFCYSIWRCCCYWMDIIMHPAGCFMCAVAIWIEQKSFFVHQWQLRMCALPVKCCQRYYGHSFLELQHWYFGLKLPILLVIVFFSFCLTIVLQWWKVKVSYFQSWWWHIIYLL